MAGILYVCVVLSRRCTCAKSPHLDYGRTPAPCMCRGKFASECIRSTVHPACAGASSPARDNHPAEWLATPHWRYLTARKRASACHHYHNQTPLPIIPQTHRQKHTPPYVYHIPCHHMPNISPPQAHRRPTTSPPHATISPTQAHHKPTIGSPQAHHRPNTSPPQAHHSLLPPTALSGLGTAPNFSPTLWHYML